MRKQEKKSNASRSEAQSHPNQQSKSTLEPLFTGQWEIAGLYCNVSNEGWKPYNSYSRGVFIWQCEQEKQILYKDGYVEVLGEIEEVFINSHNNYATYIYSPGDRFLQIERPFIQPEPEINICLWNNYIVEHFKAEEYWLYPVRDKRQTLDECEYRIKIRKVEVTKL